MAPIFLKLIAVCNILLNADLGHLSGNFLLFRALLFPILRIDKNAMVVTCRTIIEKLTVAGFPKKPLFITIHEGGRY